MNAETRTAWADVARQVSAQRPDVGKRVRVTSGKRAGTVGTVERHQRSKYGQAFRYGGEANLHLREMAGRNGFAVRVRPEEGGEAFWTGGQSVEVIDAKGEVVKAKPYCACSSPGCNICHGGAS
jgi:hypothetical protein